MLSLLQNLPQLPLPAGIKGACTHALILHAHGFSYVLLPQPQCAQWPLCFGKLRKGNACHLPVPAHCCRCQRRHVPPITIPFSLTRLKHPEKQKQDFTLLFSSIIFKKSLNKGCFHLSTFLFEVKSIEQKWPHDKSVSSLGKILKSIAADFLPHQKCLEALMPGRMLGFLVANTSCQKNIKPNPTFGCNQNKHLIIPTGPTALWAELCRYLLTGHRYFPSEWILLGGERLKETAQRAAQEACDGGRVRVLEYLCQVLT